MVAVLAARVHMSRLLILVTVGFLIAAQAAAHHAAHAFFGGPEVLIKGTLTGVRLVNPHAYFRVTMDDGTDWVFESAGSGTMLRNDGLTDADFASGQRVAMTGESNKEGRKNARIITIAIYGEADDDDLTLYVIGASLPNAAWAQRIDSSAARCNEGTIARCYTVSRDLRQQVEEGLSGEHGLW
jgi:hypothetical protein